METQELYWKWKGMKVGNYGSEGKWESKNFDGVCGRVRGGHEFVVESEEAKEEEKKNKEDKEVVEER